MYVRGVCKLAGWLASKENLFICIQHLAFSDYVYTNILPFLIDLNVIFIYNARRRYCHPSVYSIHIVRLYIWRIIIHVCMVYVFMYAYCLAHSCLSNRLTDFLTRTAVLSRSYLNISLYFVSVSFI